MAFPYTTQANVEKIVDEKVSEKMKNILKVAVVPESLLEATEESRSVTPEEDAWIRENWNASHFIIENKDEEEESILMLPTVKAHKYTEEGSVGLFEIMFGYQVFTADSALLFSQLLYLYYNVSEGTIDITVIEA